MVDKNNNDEFENKEKVINETQEKEEIVNLEVEDVEVDNEPTITPLQIAQQELENCKNSMLRLQADFENYKKRNKDMNSKMYTAGICDAVEVLFPVLDSLDHASNMYKSKNDKAGIELITKQFLSALEKVGVKEIEALEKDFNPNIHEAIAKCDASSDEEKNKIVEVLRKGYILGDKVLRPTMVKVAN